MPCSQMAQQRAVKLGLQLPIGTTEFDLWRELNARSHEEVHEKLEGMSDEEFRLLIERLRRKKSLASVAILHEVMAIA